MAQNQFVNLTVSANAAKIPDSTDHRHTVTPGASSSGDLTISFDATKFTTLAMLNSAIAQAAAQVRRQANLS